MKRLDVEPSESVLLETIAEDRAGRNEDLVRFIHLLANTEGPYTYMIDSPWGDGKTFFVKSVKMVLEALNPNISSTDGELAQLRGVCNRLVDVSEPMLPVYFNAWVNDFADDPLTALFANMAVELGQTSLCKETDLKIQIASVIDALLGVCGLDGSIASAVESLSGESIIAAYERRSEVRERVNAMADAALPEVANKLVLFIDELDRCRPDFAVRLLEQTKSLFQNDRVILVFSTDSHQLAKAVGGMYGPGFDTTHFLERFFDFRLRLTPVDAYKLLGSGERLDLSYRFDRLVNEVAMAKSLTIRDWSRIKPKLDQARRYQLNRPYGLSEVYDFAICMVLPLLVFIEREDSHLFRLIVTGSDFDALFDYGKQYDAFMDVVKELAIGQYDEDLALQSAIEKPCRDYVRAFCVFVYGSDDKVNTFEAGRTIGILGGRIFDPRVFKNLAFE